jgi:Holliday junction resolvase-like predicted endonuclease
MKFTRLTLGKQGEQLVINALQQEGFYIEKTNAIFYYKGKKIGEVDIVASKGDTLFLVEVKTSNRIQGEPIWNSKQKARLYALSEKCLDQWPRKNLRFGLALVFRRTFQGPLVIRWFYPESTDGAWYRK